MDRHKLALECAKIEKTGGNVRDFLRQQGCISPWGTWYRLQREELGRTEEKITEGKGDERMGQVRLTDIQKAEAVKIAIAGGDPRKYLRDCGSDAPKNMWWKIRRDLKEKDPETFKKLPAKLPWDTKDDRLPIMVPSEKTKKKTAAREKIIGVTDPKTGGKGAIKTMEGETENETKVGLVYDPSIEEEYRREKAENAEKIDHRKQIKVIKVTAAEGAAGTWKRNGDFLTLQIRRPDGPEDTGAMTAEEWITAAEELPAVLKMFGMEA